jgi:hypothetical protein
MTLDAATLYAIMPFVAVGPVAQLVDGAMGMAFGVITNTLLAAVLGLAPARSSMPPAGAAGGRW